MQKMNDAQRRLAEENLPLVSTMIGRFGLRYDFEELRGVGTLGLCKAAASWNPQGGTAFSTYACHLIRNELINYVSGISRKPAEHLSLEDCEGVLRAEERGFEQVESKLFTQSLLQNLPNILDEYEMRIVRMLLDGRSLGEIAESFGQCPSSITKSRVRIGQKLLRWANGEDVGK